MAMVYRSKSDLEYAIKSMNVRGARRLAYEIHADRVLRLRLCDELGAAQSQIIKKILIEMGELPSEEVASRTAGDELEV